MHILRPSQRTGLDMVRRPGPTIRHHVLHQVRVCSRKSTNQFTLDDFSITGHIVLPPMTQPAYSHGLAIFFFASRARARSVVWYWVSRFYLARMKLDRALVGVRSDAGFDTCPCGISLCPIGVFWLIRLRDFDGHRSPFRWKSIAISMEIHHGLPNINSELFPNVNSESLLCCYYAMFYYFWHRRFRKCVCTPILIHRKQDVNFYKSIIFVLREASKITSVNRMFKYK